MCVPLAAAAGLSFLGNVLTRRQEAKKVQRMQNAQLEEQNALKRQQDNKRTEASSNYLFDVENSGAGGSDGGIGNTFLTGSQGVSNNQLNLGKNNILGG